MHGRIVSVTRCFVVTFRIERDNIRTPIKRMLQPRAFFILDDLCPFLSLPLVVVEPVILLDVEPSVSFSTFMTSTC